MQAVYMGKMIFSNARALLSIGLVVIGGFLLIATKLGLNAVASLRSAQLSETNTTNQDCVVLL
jgi:hypothetical protein